MDTMTIQEKRAWLYKHEANWHTSVLTTEGNSRVFTLWYTPYSGRQFQGMGRNNDVAVDRLFNRVYKALRELCK